MKNYAIRTPRRRRMHPGWAAAACGIVTLGFSSTALSGAESHRHGHGHHHPQPIQAISLEHQPPADQGPHAYGASSFQQADTAGLWNGYGPGGCSECQPVPESSGTATCGCGHCGGKRNNPVRRVFDRVAGGINDLIRFGGPGLACDEASCDDGCDAATLEELRQLEVHAVPMIRPNTPSWDAEQPEHVDASIHRVPDARQPTGKPAASQQRNLPAPVLPDAKVDPFADEAAWTPGRNPAIERSAYFE